MDRLSIEDIEDLATQHDTGNDVGLQINLAQQLLDALRENERLHDALTMAGNILNQENINTDFVAEALWKNDAHIAACTAYMACSPEISVNATAMKQALKAYDGIKSLRQLNESEEEYHQRLFYTIKAFSVDKSNKHSEIVPMMTMEEAMQKLDEGGIKRPSQNTEEK